MQWTGFGGCQALVDPAKTRSWKCIRRPSTLPVSQGTGGSLFPSVRATRSDTVSVRLGNVKLGLDSEKKEAYQLPLKSEQRKTSVEGTAYIHFTACTTHSMFRALFGVPHLFARELLMNRPINIFNNSSFNTFPGTSQNLPENVSIFFAKVIDLCLLTQNNQTL